MHQGGFTQIFHVFNGRRRRQSGLVLLVTFLVLSLGIAQETGLANIVQIPSSIPKWGMGEVTLQSQATFSNPFTDVQVTGVFTSPSGKTFTVDGFFDGDGKGGQAGNVWKVRFMPNEVGSWSYTISSSPSTPGLSASGSFSATSSGNRGPIKTDITYPYSMVYSNGQPFFQNGTLEKATLFAEETSQGWRFQLINWMADRGINLYTVLAAFDMVGYRVIPWLQNPDIDFTRYDLKKMHEWEEVFLLMNQRGIHFMLFFYGANQGGLASQMGAASAQEKAYFKYLISRFAAFPNLAIWNLMGEYEEIRSQSWAQTMAQWVKDNDPYDHLITTHQGEKASFDFAGDARFDVTGLQVATFSNVPSVVNDAVIQVRNQVAGANRKIPVRIDEFFLPVEGPATRKDVRAGAWAISLAGGSYLIFPYWDWFAENANLSIPQPYFEDTKRIKDFMETTQYWKGTPHNELVNNGGSSNFCLANPGQEYIIYSINGGTVTLNLSQTTNTFTAKWFDPKTGTYSGQSTVSGGANRSLSSPFTGDTVLHLSVASGDTTAPNPPTGLKVSQ